MLPLDMKLTDYLARQKKNDPAFSQVTFAAALGISQSQVSRLASGESRPSFKIVEKIERVTGGAVSFSDFRMPEQPAGAAA